MSDLHGTVEDLRRQSAKTRLQFLRVEVQSCRVALEMAEYELSVGGVEVVEKEIGVVEAGIRALRHFLPDVEDEGEKKRIEASAGELEARLARLKEHFAERNS